MPNSLYTKISEQIGHNYTENYKLLKYIADNYDVKSLPREEYKKLDAMYSACIQIHHFKEVLGLDISEVDIKKYTLDSEYRGQFFDLEMLDDVFECAEGGEIKSMMFLAAAFKEGCFASGLQGMQPVGGAKPYAGGQMR